MQPASQGKQEGRHPDDGARLLTAHQFGEIGQAVGAAADDGGAEAVQAEAIGESSHETAIEGGGDEDPVPRGNAGGAKRHRFVTCQPLQVGHGLQHRHRLPGRSRGETDIGDLLRRNTEKFCAAARQIVFGGQGIVCQVRATGTDRRGQAALGETPAVEGRVLAEIGDVPAQQGILKSLPAFNLAKFVIGGTPGHLRPARMVASSRVMASRTSRRYLT